MERKPIGSPMRKTARPPTLTRMVVDRRAAVIVAGGFGLVVLAGDLVYALSIFNHLGQRDADFGGPEGAIMLVWLLVAIALAACTILGAARRRVTWVWWAGIGEALGLAILVGIGGAFWSMFVGGGLIVLAALIAGSRAGNLRN